MRKKKARKLISELAIRRDEVVTRAKMVANKQLPQNLLDSDFPTTIEWIITPHIKEDYEHFQQVKDKDVRRFQNLMGKMLKAFSKKKKIKGEENKKEKSN